MMDVPQLHGLGPAANRLLDSYSQLLKVKFRFLMVVRVRKPMKKRQSGSFCYHV